MGSVAEALELFIQSLELTDRQRDEVSRQHTMVREELRQRLRQKTDFLSGSYSRHTAIRPLHDIDIFVVLGDVASTPSETPDAALKRVRQALKAAWPNKELPILQQHSVHLEFTTSGLEFDVVPAWQLPGPQEVYLIPERHTGRWIRTNPRRHQELSTQFNERAGKKLKPLIKAVKHWNRQQGSSPLGSFHLEAMSYTAFSSPPVGYLEGLEALFGYLVQRVMQPCPDPAGLGANVDARMTDGQREAARNLFMGAARTLRLAREERDSRPGDAHARLRAFFGNEYRER
ncbi:CBASS oligonucleotide cyclase [Myxococcus sp. RHSTA-1-4]|uniref:CBASS oligonucleotide cyclase n=1 Tax=Myxococcus sp. RHSTA-1-4 TaxID=2874601 RepID=UPI001CBF12D6|nr:CBASS oligonucleotide cyclase [Myxococcus sp. RHSTA-1-4]MBZ4422697.1 nucleotidyltransferase [Myxococcus sp. RHSTA-1-4]